MFDAYNVKKILPRLLIAVVLIQLSWFLFTGLIMIMNAVAYGIEGLIYAPWGGLNNMTLIDLLQGVKGGTGLFTTLTIAGAGATIVGAIAVGGIMTTAGIILLGVLIAFAMLLFRQVIIVGLLIISPLAIAAWILPGTEKYWKMWWDSFFKLLLVYPIILGIVAIGRVLAFVTAGVSAGQAQNTGIWGTISGTGSNLVNFFLVLVCLFGPFYLIPKTFQLAGGVFQVLTGTINNKSKGAFDRLKNRRAKTWQTKGERTGRRVLQKRSDYYNRLMAQGSKGGALRRSTVGLLARGGARTVGGYNIEAASSARRAAVGKELNDQIATGRDEEIRGLTVNKAWALKHGKQSTDGEDGDWRIKDGKRQFKTLGGGWVDEAYVDRGHQRWGNDTYAQQAALSYEMRKASTSNDSQRIASNYGIVAEGWGMNKTLAQGAWTGAAFENQNTHLEYKNMSFDSAKGPGKLGGMAMNQAGYKKFAEEVHEKRDPYSSARFHANVFEQLDEGYRTLADDDTRVKVAEIAENFVARGGVQQQIGAEGEGDEQRPITQTVGGDAVGGRAVTMGSGAASVNQSIRKLAETTGRLAADAPIGGTTPAPGITPPDNGNLTPLR